MSTQNYSNHAKVVKSFVFFVVPVLVLNLISAIYMVFGSGRNTANSVRVLVFGGIHILVAVALLFLAFLARTFALGVQDRVIRLEERLRYRQLLPEDLRPRIDEFTIHQIVSLRFASDEELPALARKVLDAGLNNRKAIKRMVQNWRPDYQRV